MSWPAVGVKHVVAINSGLGGIEFKNIVPVCFYLPLVANSPMR